MNSVPGNCEVPTVRHELAHGLCLICRPTKEHTLKPNSKDPDSFKVLMSIADQNMPTLEEGGAKVLYMPVPNSSAKVVQKIGMRLETQSGAVRVLGRRSGDVFVIPQWEKHSRIAYAISTVSCCVALLCDDEVGVMVAAYVSDDNMSGANRNNAIDSAMPQYLSYGGRTERLYCRIISDRPAVPSIIEGVAKQLNMQNAERLQIITFEAEAEVGNGHTEPDNGEHSLIVIIRKPPPNFVE